jgi:hypothetical protein
MNSNDDDVDDDDTCGCCVFCTLKYSVTSRLGERKIERWSFTWMFSRTRSLGGKRSQTRRDHITMLQSKCTITAIHIFTSLSLLSNLTSKVTDS